MNANQYKDLVNSVSVGKKLPDAVYVHTDSFESFNPQLHDFIFTIGKALKIERKSWNVVKLFTREFRISLLSYPDFFSDSYPALTRSVTVDLVKLSHRITNYSDSDNPPILHRKETMLLPSHPNYQLFKDITEEGERAGLYESSRMIGFKSSWLNLIRKKGYELIDGRLFRSSMITSSFDSDESTAEQIDRHKTALVRHDLSAPMKSLAKYGFLDGAYSIFDYGCGRGDDLRELEAHGIDALGWDPNFRPDSDKVSSDIVNLGYVVNVIEDQDERLEALINAWELSNSLLVVSAMLANENYIQQFTPYKDGVITSRKTFQKYYTQAELKSYIERVTHEEPIAVAPGIFFVFRDKLLESTFLQNRHKRSYEWQQKTSPTLIAEEQKRLLFTSHKELLESFWLTCLVYGRCPAPTEFQQLEVLKAKVGSVKKAFSLVKDWYGEEELQLASKMRKEDILIYICTSMFQKRKAFANLNDSLKRDIKVFFSNYKTATGIAEELLFEIANVEKIEEQCLEASQYLPASKLDYEFAHPHSLTFHKQFLGSLSPLLRVYVSAALQLYGDLDDIQLIKIHITSGKLSLMGYEGFEELEFPKLKERVKIKMAEQDVDFFDYVDERSRPILENKACYL